MKRLTRYFFRGLLFLAPIAITVFVFYKVFVWIDEPLGGMLQQWFGIQIWGLGFLLTVIFSVALVTVTGMLASNLLAQHFMDFIDSQFQRFPFVKLLYSAIKDLVGAFVGGKRKFDQPVLVTLVPGSNVQAIGFVTRKSLDMWGLADRVAVYLPQSYNFAGNMVIVPSAQVMPLNVASGDVLTFVVSGGISGGEAPGTAAEGEQP